jgi:hypothetical protein
VAFGKCPYKGARANKLLVCRSFKVESSYPKRRRVSVEVYCFLTRCIKEVLAVVLLNKGIPLLDIVLY